MFVPLYFTLLYEINWSILEYGAMSTGKYRRFEGPWCLQNVGAYLPVDTA
jgi:hypothetical protein